MTAQIERNPRQGVELRAPARPQAIRRPRAILRGIQVMRRPCPRPRSLKDAAAFLILSAAWLLALAVVGHTLGVLHVGP